MGDAPPGPSSAAEYPTREASAPPLPDASSLEAHSGYPQRGAVAESQSTFPQQYQQQYGNPQHAFSSQFDMAQPQGPVRPGHFNMNAMMNALPQANYRQPQFSTGAQRFSPSGSSPTVVGQIQPVSQYVGQASVGPIANQQFYLPQQGHMAPYYSAPISPSQQQGNIPSRPSMGFYPGQVVMNSQAQPSAAYYYPQAAHFPGQSHSMQAQILAGGYLPTTASSVDPRIPQIHGGEHPGGTIFPQPSDPRHGRFSFHLIWPN